MADQFDVRGKVTLDTGQAAAGAKQVESAVEKMAKTEVEAIRKLEQQWRQTAAATGKSLAQVMRSQGEDLGFVKARYKDMGIFGQRAANEIAEAFEGRTSHGIRQAQSSAMVFERQLGIQMPRAINAMLARSQLIGPALQAAFSLSIIALFIANIGRMIESIQELSLAWGGYTKRMQEDFKSALAANERALRQFATTGIGQALLLETNTRIAALEREKLALEKRAQAMGLGLTWLTKHIFAGGRLAEIEDQLSILEARRIPQLEQQNKLEVEAAKVKAKHASAAERLAEIYRAWWAGGGPAAAWENIRKSMEAGDRKYYEKLSQTSLENMQAVWQEQQKLAGEETAMLQRGAATNLEIERKAAAERKSIYNKTAQSIESFIDRVFLTARSLSDVFHQFLMQLLGSFAKWVSHMLASWLTGVRSAASAGGSGGGILGSLLGGILGTGGGTSSTASALASTATTAALTGSALGGSLALGGTQAVISAGGSGALASSVFAETASTLGGSTIPAAAGGASSGVLGKYAFGGISAVSSLLSGGLALGGISLASAGGPVKGALGGAMTGAGVAMGLAGLSAHTGILAGLMAVPHIGWILAGIGGLIGGLVGLFSRGKQKKKANALEVQYEAAANDLLEQYLQHELDYDSALEQLTSVLSTGQEALINSGTGKWGKKAAATLATAIEADLEKLASVQEEREARTSALAEMTVPEFAVGGYVGAGSNGPIVAMLHPGEFVMQKSAVDSLGANFLAALNRAPRFADGGAVSGGGRAAQNVEVHFHVSAIDGQSVEQFFRRSEGYIVRTLRKAAWAGAM